MFSTSIKCDISASNEHIRTRSYVIYCNHYFRSPGVFAAQSEHIAIPPGTHDRKGTHKELMMIYDCIIIGAGASGLFCSASMDRPVRGLILEKTKHPGTKLLMSGSGQCNITHAGSIKDFIDCYGRHGGRIRKCLYRYSNTSLTGFMESGGVPVVTREDGKVFPASMDARDVLDMLLRRSRECGFSIEYDSPAEKIEKNAHGWTVLSSEQRFDTKTLVIATGGCSYPRTGSDGSIFRILKRDLELKCTELKPALSSVQVKDYPYGELSGISFENAEVSIWKDGRKEASNSGGLLFTHGDLSGPAVLNISKYASPGGMIQISYLHPLDRDTVLSRLKKAAHQNSAKLSGIIADEFGLPKRFCQLLTARYGESLKKLASQLTEETFEINSVSDFRKAMCTSGGVDLSCIDLSTMQAKKLPGIYVIGEALDIDGITGGYNLQFAYSSACAAADDIARTV